MNEKYLKNATRLKYLRSFCQQHKSSHASKYREVASKTQPSFLQADLKMLKPRAAAQLLQAASLLLFSCAAEKYTSRIFSLLVYELVHVFQGCITFYSKRKVETCLRQTYNAVYHMFSLSNSEESKGCITFDGWSAALVAPLVSVTRNYGDLETVKHSNCYS